MDPGLAQALFSANHDFSSGISFKISNTKTRWPFLEALCIQNILPYLDYLLAEKLLKNYPEVAESAAVLICHISLASRQGHLCIKLCNHQVEPSPIEVWQAPEDRPWDPNTLDQINRLILEGTKNLPFTLMTDTECVKKAPFNPICKYNSFYYFQKYWVYETLFLEQFQRLRLSQPQYSYDQIIIQQKVSDLELKGKLLQEQAEAILKASKNCLTIISGGPGTGKTYTAAYIIQMLWEGLNTAHRDQFEILLTAPTGKAAAQLQKSLVKISDLLTGIKPLTAKTLHSLLDISKNRVFIKESITLSADLIIVDECSMIDIKVMIKLLASVKLGARIILLGDPFQLPSVEAGGMFHDIISTLNIQPNPLLKPAFLKTCLRSELKGILSLAEYVKWGQTSKVLELTLQNSDGIHFFPLHSSEIKQGLEFIKSQASHFYSYNNIESPEALLSSLNLFKLLSPLRKGPFGVDHLNNQIHETLLKKHSESKPFLTPIMIASNHKGLNLFNGETGILVTKGSSINPYSFQKGDYAIFSSNEKNSPRIVPAVLLPRFELAYVLSVHKSQGSEFDHVILIFPEGSQIFGRKALYTGITRAKKQLTLFSNETILKGTIEYSGERISGVINRAIY